MSSNKTMSELKKIIKQIAMEKGLPEESIYETINSALAAAYRKDFGNKDQNIVAEYNIENGDLRVFDEKTVVENLTEEEKIGIEKLKEMREARKTEMENTGKVVEKSTEEEQLEETTRKFNPKNEIELSVAQEIDKKYQIGDIIRTELEVPGEFGRMAAQTAKQVIIQKLREAERNIVFEKYKDKIGAIVYGIVQKRDGRNVIVDVENIPALMPMQEQVRNERYNLGDRIKVAIVKIEQTLKGPEIIVSRASNSFIERLFENEIPEIANGTITIKNIAREPGMRAKVAVHTDDENIDPIGSCIGQRGARIQTIIAELNGEKIDIIKYDQNPKKYIGNALMPAKITNVEINEADQSAVVTVPADQLSLTIGRDGQNVRLAVRLTGWKINIREQESGKEIMATPVEVNNIEQITENTEVKETPTEPITEDESSKAKEDKPKKRVTKKTKK